MANDNKKQSTVTAGTGYRSIKSTEIYTPDTVPINYQSPVIEDIKNPSPTHIALEQDKPKTNIIVRDSFLDSLSSVYISGMHAMKGHRSMRVKEIISLIVRNTGLYRVVVTSQTLQNNIISIIDDGREDILGGSINKYERDRIIMKFKHDNALS
jgi:hypothetical protein